MKTEQTYKLEADVVGGVAVGGDSVWLSLISAGSGSLARFDKATGTVGVRVPTGTVTGMAWDGQYLWGITRDGIQCFDAETFAIVRTLPRPKADGFLSGLAWDGEALWVGDYAEKRLYKLDAKTGAVLRVLNSDRFVTGITWAGDELWHATGDDDKGGQAAPVEIRRLDAENGRVLETHAVPYTVSGLAFTGAEFLCGDCATGTLRIVSHAAE